MTEIPENGSVSIIISEVDFPIDPLRNILSLSLKNKTVGNILLVCKAFYMIALELLPHYRIKEFSYKIDQAGNISSDFDNQQILDFIDTLSLSKYRYRTIQECKIPHLKFPFETIDPRKLNVVYNINLIEPQTETPIKPQTESYTKIETETWTKLQMSSDRSRIETSRDNLYQEIVKLWNLLAYKRYSLIRSILKSLFKLASDSNQAASVLFKLRVPPPCSKCRETTEVQFFM
jgi:hypothetical protein